MKKLKIAMCILGGLLIMSCNSNSSNPQLEGYTAEAPDGLMFDEEEFTRFYNYAPTLIIEGDRGYVWYCSNPASGMPGDHIAYREGINVKGTWYWGEKKLVLAPGERGEWDQMHVCDPSVVAGLFDYQNETYNYLMAYLGCMTDGNYENTLGFAVSKTIEGPWIRVKSVSPLYDFYTLYPDAADGKNQWGIGQPSIINIDKEGKILLFYTKHYRPSWGSVVERWNFRDLDNPVKEMSVDLTGHGLKQTTGLTDYVTNSDFAYDEQMKKIYVVGDVHPFNAFFPNNVPDLSRVASRSLSFMETDVGDSINNFEWEELFFIDKAKTQFDRNSNCAFYRDKYGHIIDRSNIDIAYSRAVAADTWNYFFTMRICRININKYKEE